MTVDEIKQANPMPEVLARYGIKVRHKMCSCPWHKDKHPSMAVYDNGVKCFSCGWSGDVFSFVQKMDGCDFKTAFYSLGGTYQHDPKKRLKTAYKVRRNIKQDTQKRQGINDHKLMVELLETIRICRAVIDIYEPFSDLWCECCDALPFLEYACDMKYELDERIDEIDVYRKCRTIKQQVYLR